MSPWIVAAVLAATFAALPLDALASDKGKGTAVMPRTVIELTGDVLRAVEATRAARSIPPESASGKEPKPEKQPPEKEARGLANYARAVVSFFSNGVDVSSPERANGEPRETNVSIKVRPLGWGGDVRCIVEF